MRTTIDIPENLIKEAMQVSEAKTKTTAIVLGLKELIHRSQIEELRSLRGKMHLKVNLAKSRER